MICSIVFSDDWWVEDWLLSPQNAWNNVLRDVLPCINLLNLIQKQGRVLQNDSWNDKPMNLLQDLSSEISNKADNYTTAWINACADRRSVPL